MQSSAGSDALRAFSALRSSSGNIGQDDEPCQATRIRLLRTLDDRASFSHSGSRFAPCSANVSDGPLSVIAPPEIEGHVHQADQDRHLNEGADNRRESLAGVDAEDRHGHGDRQLEVVAGGGEGQGRRLCVVRSGLHAHEERDKEHDHESR